MPIIFLKYRSKNFLDMFYCDNFTQIWFSSHDQFGCNTMLRMREFVYFSQSDDGKFIIWVKVFKIGPSKICGRQPFKNLKSHFKFFKGCLPQIVPGPFLNTLTHMEIGEFTASQNLKSFLLILMFYTILTLRIPIVEEGIKLIQKGSLDLQLKFESPGSKVQ